jgi:hypothetical protein
MFVCRSLVLVLSLTFLKCIEIGLLDRTQIIKASATERYSSHCKRKYGCCRRTPLATRGTITAAIKYDSIFYNERKTNAVAMKKYTWANRCLLSVYSYIESGQNTCFTHLYEKTIAVFPFFSIFFFCNYFYIFLL